MRAAKKRSGMLVMKGGKRSRAKRFALVAKLLFGRSANAGRCAKRSRAKLFALVATLLVGRYATAALCARSSPAFRRMASTVKFLAQYFERAEGGEHREHDRLVEAREQEGGEENRGEGKAEFVDVV